MRVERVAEPIVVTGATGFIGRRVVRRLRDERYPVRAFVLPDDVVPAEWDAEVQVERGDITRLGDVATAIKGAATVFHLAAMVGDWGLEERHRRITVRGTEHVLGEAARMGTRVLLSSSVVVYGTQIGRTVCDEQLPMGRPLGPYSRAKQAQERIARELEASRGLRVTIIRPTNVFGPGSLPWVEKLSEHLARGLPSLVNHGRRDAGLTYVDNVVDVFVRAAERPGSVGRVYNANDDSGVTWHRYVHDLAELVGAPKPKHVDARLATLAAVGCDVGYKLLRREERPPITREALNLLRSHHRVPIARARRELGYDPIVSYEEGMRRVAEHLSERGKAA